MYAELHILRISIVVKRVGSITIAIDMDYECRQRVDMDTSDPDSQKMLRNDWRFQTSRQSSGQLTDGSESDNIVNPISPDLVFGDVTLERAYRTLHTESQVGGMVTCCYDTNITIS